eukprot:8415399-Lingulodinium_polyedra.AAC.1
MKPDLAHAAHRVSAVVRSTRIGINAHGSGERPARVSSHALSVMTWATSTILLGFSTGTPDL